jgi:hypothetical protein
MTHFLTKWPCVLASGILLMAGFQARAAQAEASADLPVQTTTQGPAQLQQLVAPIALYPDVLVAQVLAAATYPDEIVEADRWMDAHSGLTEKERAKGVDKESWDPAVKAVAAFPAVLGSMDKNLAWTSSLGDAYLNQQSDVMSAIQAMRQLARKAGTLQSTDQQKVNAKGRSIVIEPANTEVVYVPQYDPWMVYGGPIGPWPGWYGYPGLFWDGPGIGFGLGLDLGFFAGFGWGWNHWSADWDHRSIAYNHSTYISHSRSIVNRRAMAARSQQALRPGVVPGNADGFRGGAHPEPRSGAFGGFTHGGVARTLGARGRMSLGGVHGAAGGGVHGGGGRR